MITQDRLLQLKNGDADAFAELYEMGQSKLFGYFFSRTQNNQLSEDLCHDVWAKVMDRIDKYEIKGSIPIMSWIFRIAHNSLVDYLRVHSKTVLSIDRMSPDGDVWQLQDTKVETQDASVEHKDVHHAVEQLVDKQRQVILHRFFKGYSILETSQAIGVSEDAVKKLQSRAMIRMRRILGRDYCG